MTEPSLFFCMILINQTELQLSANHSLFWWQLANPDIGRIIVKYCRVECTPQTDMLVSVLDFAGSNGWLRLAIDVSVCIILLCKSYQAFIESSTSNAVACFEPFTIVLCRTLVVVVLLNLWRLTAVAATSGWP